MRLTVSLLAVALLVAMAAPADAGPSLSQTYKLAKRADKRAKQALAAVQRPLVASTTRQGERGQTGFTGLAGSRGSDGANGAVGARGANGAEGVAGRDGRDGADGADGVAIVGLLSATNTGTVDVAGGGTTVVSLDVDAGAGAHGRSLVTVDGQLNSENSTASGVACELRADGTTVADRYVTLAGSSVETISASTVVENARSLAFVCQKSSIAAVVQFPAGRVRLSVLGA